MNWESILLIIIGWAVLLSVSEGAKNATDSTDSSDKSAATDVPADITKASNSFSDATDVSDAYADVTEDSDYLTYATEVSDANTANARNGPVDATDVSDSPTNATDTSEAPDITPVATLDEEMLSSVNFLRMIHRNCSVAYLQVNDGQEEITVEDTKEKTESCVVGFWIQGILPLWLHPVSYEGLLDTLSRASQKQKEAFTEQLCPCKSIQVTKKCPKKVTEALVPFILPCIKNQKDESEKGDAEIIAMVQKAMQNIQLFEKAKARLSSTLPEA